MKPPESCPGDLTVWIMGTCPALAPLLTLRTVLTNIQVSGCVVQLVVVLAGSLAFNDW